LAHLGLVAYLGRAGRRATCYRECLALEIEIGDEAAWFAVSVKWRHWRWRAGSTTPALRAWRRRPASPCGPRLPSPPVERSAAKRLEAEIRAELSPVRLATAWLAGRVLRLEQAAQLGLALLDSVALAMALLTLQLVPIV